MAGSSPIGTISVVVKAKTPMPTATTASQLRTGVRGVGGAADRSVAAGAASVS
jgi:hypothetical protein